MLHDTSDVSIHMSPVAPLPDYTTAFWVFMILALVVGGLTVLYWTVLVGYQHFQATCRQNGQHPLTFFDHRQQDQDTNSNDKDEGFNWSYVIYCGFFFPSVLLGASSMVALGTVDHKMDKLVEESVSGLAIVITGVVILVIALGCTGRSILKSYREYKGFVPWLKQRHIIAMAIMMGTICLALPGLTLLAVFARHAEELQNQYDYYGPVRILGAEQEDSSRCRSTKNCNDQYYQEQGFLRVGFGHDWACPNFATRPASTTWNPFWGYMTERVNAADPEDRNYWCETKVYVPGCDYGLAYDRNEDSYPNLTVALDCVTSISLHKRLNVQPLPPGYEQYAYPGKELGWNRSDYPNETQADEDVMMFYANCTTCEAIQEYVFQEQLDILESSKIAGIVLSCLGASYFVFLLAFLPFWYARQNKSNCCRRANGGRPEGGGHQEEAGTTADNLGDEALKGNGDMENQAALAKEKKETDIAVELADNLENAPPPPPPLNPDFQPNLLLAVRKKQSDRLPCS